MAASAIDIEVVSDHGRFLELKPEWDLLLAQLGDQASVFLSHYWLDCWWRHFGGDAKLHLLVLRREGRMIAIAPLMRRRLSLYGLPVRCLCFPENGNTLHSDLLVGEAERGESLTELLSYLDRNRREWDLVHLHRMPGDSPNLAVALNLLRETGVKHHLRSVYASPYLKVAGGWQAFHAGRSVRVRKTLRNVRNSLERAACPDLVRVATWEEFLEQREAICRIASHSWTEEEGDSLATPVNRAFFEDLAREAAREGGLRVWLLLLDGRPAAFEFHLRGFGKQHALRASFDEEFASLSPGAFLEMELLREIYDEPQGVAHFDFGGSTDPYKKRWSDQARELVLLQLFNAEPYSRLCSLYATLLIPLLRQVRDLLRRKG
ncbi:FemAB superfamily protein [Citrifermentans bemidjiense Bem]|uniref:FemAB superfamily protein n=1 Tax=Citrifermentans bemidjiense (strain ATCC BAA-1014 / DSM 16622 / JCM 12645 / Bem) TaxID=404380 RepID=B5EA93_CITBB|nr:GNAT family N-acetyltransferase [Citrifermentans bemidjiense]ACH38799.1 FemAB superfamily protein [Citrifermentans bemidjiense Bem]